MGLQDTEEKCTENDEGDDSHDYLCATGALSVALCPY